MKADDTGIELRSILWELDGWWLVLKISSLFPPSFCIHIKLFVCITLCWANQLYIRIWKRGCAIKVFALLKHYVVCNIWSLFFGSTDLIWSPFPDSIENHYEVLKVKFHEVLVSNLIGCLKQTDSCRSRYMTCGCDICIKSMSGKTCMTSFLFDEIIYTSFSRRELRTIYLIKLDLKNKKTNDVYRLSFKVCSSSRNVEGDTQTLVCAGQTTVLSNWTIF